MKKYLNFLSIICLLTGCKETKQQQIAIQDLPVITLQEGSATTYQSYPASIEGILNIEIRPQVTGILDRTFVDDGQLVKKGQPLFAIESAPFRERVNSAKAAYRAAKGALEHAQIEINKITPLVANQVVSDFQLKTALSAKETAQGNLEQAKAEIAEASINLGYTIIKAPANGYIGRLLRKQGSLIGPADPTPLTELSDVHKVHVFFAMGESDFILFKTNYPGRTLEEKIKGLPEVELITSDDSTFKTKGKVDIINGQFDRNTGAITFRATFENQDRTLRSGNTGKVKLGLKFEDQLIVPQSATLEMQDQTFVYALDGKNKVSKRLIAISGVSGTNYIIRPELSSGLKKGDRIVSNGFDHLHEGDVIKPVQPANQPVIKN